MRGAATLLLLTVACGARTGLRTDDAATPALRDAGGDDAGADTFPCRWTVSRPLELERDPSDICAVNGAVHARLDEVLLVWQDVSCDLAPFEGVRAVTSTLSDPPTVLATGSVPDAFSPLAGAEEGYWQIDVTTNTVTLLSTRIEPLESHEPRLDSIFGFDRLDPNRVYGRRGEQIVEWSVRGERIVGQPFDASPEIVLAQMFADDTWLGVADGRVERQRPGGPVQVGVSALEVGSIAPDRFNPGLAVLARSDELFRVDAVAGDLPMARRLPWGGSATTGPVGPVATNETEALVPLGDGTLVIQPMNGARFGLLRFSENEVRQARVLFRTGGSAGGIFSIEVDRETGEQIVVFRPMVCNR